MKLYELFNRSVDETIRKVKGGYRLVSGSGRNLGTSPTLAGAKKRERQVQYFKHAKESVEEGSLEEGSIKNNPILQQLSQELKKQDQDRRAKEMSAPVDPEELAAFQRGVERSLGRPGAPEIQSKKQQDPWKAGEGVRDLQHRRDQLVKAIDARQRLDALVDQAEKYGLGRLSVYKDDSHWDVSELWKDNYESYIASLERHIKELLDRINSQRAIYRKKKTFESQQSLTEGMRFTPAIEEPYDHPESRSKTIWSDMKWQRKEMRPCWVCDGTGKERYGKNEYECGYCKGAKETEEWVSDAPELYVSNGNGFEIQRMLGLDPDYSGHIRSEDLPAFIRRLIKLKNTDSSEYTEEPSEEGGEMRRTGSEQNVTSIGRGAKMYDMGRSQSQVDRYIDELLKIMRFAQENGAGIMWG